MDDDDEKIDWFTNRKPFKVVFYSKQPVGRSYYEGGKPMRIVVPVNEMEHNSEALVNQIKPKLVLKDPHEKFEYPMTENQSYGWYKLHMDDSDKTDRRMNFGRRTHYMTKENLMSYAKIR